MGCRQAPESDRQADWARSGVVALTGRADGPPLVPPGRAASVAAELAARFAAITGVHVDGPALLSERAAFTGHRRRGAVSDRGAVFDRGALSAGGACRLLPTADGWAAVTCARPGDPALLGALAGQDAGDDPWPAAARWLRAHTGADLARRAELLGLAAGPVAAGVPARVARPASAEVPARVPLAPSASPASPAARLLAPRPLAGALVADFSALWAGPLCAHLLGLAGARVVKVETPWRPDGARRGNPAFYRLLHAGQRCVTLDPHTPGGRAAMAALVAAADIVIESSRPRALARFGLDADAAVARGTTWVSITAYGRASDRVGFGDDVAAAAGLVARDTGGAPVFCGDAIADPLTGLTAAVRAACAPAGGALLDIAMADVVAATLDPAPEPVRPSAAARRDAGSWVVDTAEGPVPVAGPRRRPARGSAAGPGEHTDEVLRELGTGAR
jgi:crotonobetainyl-CoA:carnitine CoA-transferase CaiB-like acyl-CoA transferase